MMDIARVAGVAQSTVSRVLNNADSPVAFAPETRDRVLTAAQQLGYRPNPLARGLRGAPMMLIGAIVRDISDYFFVTAIEALVLEASSRGYQVVLGHARGRAAEAIALTAVLETRHCDAIIVLGDMRDQPRLRDDLKSVSVPVIGMWQGTASSGIPVVNVDNRVGINAVLDHLTALGHRRIAFVGGRTGDSKERRAAYLEYMHAIGQELPSEYLQHAANDPAAGAAALRALVRLPEPPTAIAASTDVLAIGVLHAAHQLGIRVPSDLSVTGFDDIRLAAFTVPSLTTVRMPIGAMMARAVDMAVHGLTLGPRGRRSLRITPSLVTRDSTDRPVGGR